MPDIYGIEKNFEIARFILQEQKEAPGIVCNFLAFLKCWCENYCLGELVYIVCVMYCIFISLLIKR